MRTKLLLAAIVVFLSVSMLAAETIDLGAADKQLNVEVLESNDQRTVVKFDIGSFEQETVNINGESYYQLRLGDESFLLNAAEPELPRVCRSIIIPDDAKMRVSILASEYTDFENYPVVPSKGNLLRNVNPDDVPYTFGEVYSTDAFYPGELANIRDPYIIRDFRGTTIDLNAFQYNPVTQRLRVYTSVTVEIANVGPGVINVLQNADRTKIVEDFKQIYSRRFINYDFQTDKYTMLTESGDMLIICYDAFMADMQPFVDWKMQKGIKTTMVGTSTAGTTSSAIKSYIQSFFDADSTNLAFVLLVGDAAQIPSPYASGGSSDPSYGKVVGTDVNPDILIGRFSAETVAHVQTQVTKSVEYEQNPYGADWFHKGTGIASDDGAGIGHNGEADNVHMGYIRDDMLAHTYTLVDEIYEPTGTDVMVTNALNNGRSYVNYCGHGSTTSWSTTGFNNTDVNNLTNDNMLPFIISVACVNGDFDGYTCFAEAWARATNGSEPTGAVASFMASINQSWAPPMWGQDEVCDLLMAETRTTFGSLCFNGSAYVIEQSGAVDISDTWLVFGDPSLQCRTDNPVAMTVNYNPACFFNVPTYDVEVVGVEGALCALYADGVLYGSAYTGADGMATINLNQFLPIGSDVTLTVTAYNKSTFTASITPASDLAIVHTPLQDTKDTLNDYQVNCTIYSSDTITQNDVILHYDVGAGYVDEVMSQVKIITEDYQAYIPVQAAGTSISYFITASNQGGFYDTTDVFTFEVIDYQMILEPDEAGVTAPVDDTAWYDMRVTNDGVLADDYTLAVTGDEWPTEIRDATGTTVISSSGTLLGDEYLDFKVMVVVPATLEGEFDEIQLTATSTGEPTLFETTTITTTSAGMPWPIPFSDNFVTTTFDMTKWESVAEAEINSLGIDEPSAPYSVNLNGQSIGGDAIETEKINLKDESNVIVKYYYQQTGGGESPDAGDDLIIEYLDGTDTWVEINRHLGADPDMTEFEEVELGLPAGAMHAEFRLKIRCTATSGNYDDWFVDDIYVGHPSDYDVRIIPSMQSQYGPAGDSAAYTLTIINKGFLDDNFDLTFDGDWNVAFFDEALSGEINATGVVAGGDSINVIVKVEVPAGTPLHTVNSTTIWATSQGDANMQAFALVETISAGFPAAIPWYETFPDDTLYTQHWFTFEGAEVTSEAPGTPSQPYSFNLDGGVDTVETQLIDLSGQSGVLLSYYYEMGGMQDPPEYGDNLWIEYLNNAGTWMALHSHEGGGEAMQEFEYVSLELPVDAHHSGLQIRMRTFGSNAGEDNWYVDNIRVDYPPSMSVSGESMTETLLQGDSAMHEMVIENTGQGGLIYQIDLVPHLRDNFVFAKPAEGQAEPASHDYPEVVYEDVAKGEDINFTGYPVTRGMGGPDNFGYYWVDSDDPNGPAFEWVDISSTGTDYAGDLADDNYIGPISIGFDFVYYGTTYNEVYIGSNGIVGFTATSMEARTPRPIPTATVPNAILALLWDDLNPTDADNPGVHLYVGQTGDMFVIQFVDYPEYRADPGDVFTGEVILYNDGRIRYQYQSIASGFDVLGCAVGIENHYGDDGLEVAYLTSYLKDGLAIEFFKPYDWMVLDKLEGEVAPGASDTIECLFRTTMDLEPGTYTADMIINNNDPVNDPTTIPMELIVLENIPYICGDADGSETVNVSDAVTVINYVFVSGTAPDPMEAADTNCDGAVNVSDAVNIINYVFVGGNAPCDTNGDGEPDC
ncbi:MAG TPA: hypothetical protein ENO22_10280 [candidate division Zixibacteria bacterium]|nr:hypothetical protein [candidate division Zixibacteria bacterium]